MFNPFNISRLLEALGKVNLSITGKDEVKVTASSDHYSLADLTMESFTKTRDGFTMNFRGESTLHPGGITVAMSVSKDSFARIMEELSKDVR